MLKLERPFGVVVLLPTNSTSSSKRFKASARKGVILSVGGPSRHLRSWSALESADRMMFCRLLGIPKLVDLPSVGANLNVGALATTISFFFFFPVPDY
jgi:hypothetical protein